MNVAGALLLIAASAAAPHSEPNGPEQNIPQQDRLRPSFISRLFPSFDSRRFIAVKTDIVPWAATIMNLEGEFATISPHICHAADMVVPVEDIRITFPENPCPSSRRKMVDQGSRSGAFFRTSFLRSMVQPAPWLYALPRLGTPLARRRHIIWLFRPTCPAMEPAARNRSRIRVNAI